MAPYGAKARSWQIKEVGEFVEIAGLKQYKGAFTGNMVDGKRLMKLNMNQLPQMGIQRYDHMKKLWSKIKRVQDACLKYEEEMNDPELQMQLSAARIQSLARGKQSRKRVEELKAEREERQRLEYVKIAQQQLEDLQSDDIRAREEAKKMQQSAEEMVEKNQRAAQLAQQEGWEVADASAKFAEKYGAAAVAIQKRARGMSQRKLVADMKERGELPGQNRIGGNVSEQSTPKAAHHGGSMKQPKVILDFPSGISSEVTHAAVKIQQRARGMNARKRFADMKVKGELPGQKREESKSSHGERQETSEQTSDTQVSEPTEKMEVLEVAGVGASDGGGAVAEGEGEKMVEAPELSVTGAPVGIEERNAIDSMENMQSAQVGEEGGGKEGGAQEAEGVEGGGGGELTEAAADIAPEDGENQGALEGRAEGEGEGDQATEAAPVGEQTLPAGEQASPSQGEAPPASEQAPSSQEQAPPAGEAPPAEDSQQAMGVGEGGEGGAPPSDEQAPPAEGEVLAAAEGAEGA